MQDLPETAAVHGGPGNPEYGGDDGEKGQRAQGRHGGYKGPNPGYQGSSEHTLEQGEGHSEDTRGKTEESGMEKLEILLHDERSPKRIHQLEHAGYEKHGADQYGTDPFKSVHLPGL